MQEMKSTNKRKEILVLIAMLICSISLFQNTAQKSLDDFYDPADDSKSYISLSNSLVNTDEFIRTEFKGTDAVETVRTPGYPFFIAKLSFGSFKNIIYLQNLMHVLSAYFLYKVIEKLIPYKLAYLVFLYYLFHPLLISLSQLFLTETLSIFLINILIFCLINKKQLFLPAIIISVLPLVRPAFLILMLGMILMNKVFFNVTNKKKRFVLILFLILPTSLWTARNYNLTDQLIFSSITGMNLLEETASGVMAINEDIDNGENLLNIINIEYEERRKWSQTLRNEVELGNISRVIANAPGRNPHEVAGAYQKYALEKILENPTETIILICRALLYNLLEPGDQIYKHVNSLYNYVFIDFVIIFINFINMIFIILYFLNLIKNKDFLNKEFIFYLFLLIPLLLLSTPNGRFGIILLSSAILLTTKHISNFNFQK